MKRIMRGSVALLIGSGLCQAVLAAASLPPGYVDFGKLAPSAAGAEFVEVNVNSNLISMVTRLAQQAEPEIAEILQGLKSIRVNVIGLTDDNREEMENKVQAIRAQLDSQGWERIVTAQQKKQDVGVYLKTRGPEAVEGVVVTVLDGKKQAVFINVVGDIKPEKIGVLGDRFHIDPLKKVGHGLEKKAPAKEVEKEENEK